MEHNCARRLGDRGVGTQLLTGEALSPELSVQSLRSDTPCKEHAAGDMGKSSPYLCSKGGRGLTLRLKPKVGSAR